MFTSALSATRVVATLALCLSAVLASSQFVNGSFEDGGGSSAGWGRACATLILDNTPGSGPTDGTWRSFMASATDGSVHANVPAGTGTTAENLEAPSRVIDGGPATFPYLLVESERV